MNTYTYMNIYICNVIYEYISLIHLGKYSYSFANISKQVCSYNCINMHTYIHTYYKYIHTCIYMYIYALFITFLSMFFVFHGENFVSLNLINKYATSTGK